MSVWTQVDLLMRKELEQHPLVSCTADVERQMVKWYILKKGNERHQEETGAKSVLKFF